MSFILETVREDEYDGLMSFLEESYGHTRGFFQEHYPTRWARERVDCGNCFIIRDGERIASHVRVFPMRLVSGGREVTIGGIGAVATHPDFRGQGHMRALMTHTSDVMRSRGYPFAVLWGNRQRYLHFGYEKCGCDVAYGITPRSVNAADSGIARYGGEQALLDAVISAHDAEHERVARTPAEYKAMLERPDGEVFVSGDRAAYAILFNKSGGRGMAEVGGDASSVPALLSHVLNECGLDGLTVRCPYGASALSRALCSVSDSWTWQPFASLKILSLRGTLEFFSDQLYKKREALGIPAEGPVTFKIRETGECATVELSGGSVNILREESGRVVELSEPEAALRFFGAPGTLEFYIPLLDHV